MEHSKNKPYIVGISGGTGSGKTTLAHALLNHLGSDCAVLIPHDAYYRDLSHLSPEDRARYNFDHPDALETALLVRHLDALKSGASVDVPVYDFNTHTRMPQPMRLERRSVVLVEGILILDDADLCQRLDLGIFVDAAPDVRLIRRLTRDVRERGRTPESVFQQYLDTVRAMHDAFVEPSRKRADLIVPGEGNTGIALTLILGHLRAVLGINH